MSKQEKTVKQDEYSPVYVTINASNNPILVGYAIKTAMDEAREYNQLLYLTVNSGNPPNPPICPPGFECPPPK